MNFATASALTGKPLLQHINKALPAIVSALLVVALGYTLATLSWQLYQGWQPVSVKAPPHRPPPAQKPVASSRQTIRQITTAWLFGKPDKARPVTPATDNAPVTRLNLVLRGVLAADPDDLAVAIIANGKGGKEEVYTIGDTIRRGVSLSEIHPDHVIINRNGVAEKVVLAKSKGVITSNTMRNTGNTAATPTNLREVREQIMKNPTSFGEYALPIVVKQGGKQIGYRLKPQKKGQLLQQYGLMPSDIITEINGVKLDKPQNGIKALRELSSANSVTLTVKRGESFVPLNIQLQ